jgi:ribonuclease-3
MIFFHKIIKRYSKEDIWLYYELKKTLKLSPSKINLYKKAFTHRSFQITDSKGILINYERLEFLGDSILDAVISDYLYKQAPRGTEGYLTQIRSKIVSRKHLNELGKDLDLIRFVKSKVTSTQVGDNIHGNIFEALIGAIYLDRGYLYCNKFIDKRVIIPYVDVPKLEGKITSYKSLIIEWCQKQKKEFVFEVYEDTGNDSIKHFSVKLFLNGELAAKGRATSKKKAEETAAKRAYFVFQKEFSNL